MIVIASYNDSSKLAHIQDKNSETALQILNTHGAKLYTYKNIVNPAFIYPYQDKLYVITENIKDYGKLYIFDKKLGLKGSTTLNGKSSCYLTKFKNKFIITHYWDGIVEILDKYLNLKNYFVQWDKKNKIQVKNKIHHLENRQIGPHTHCAVEFNDILLISNLGNDKIYVYDENMDEIDIIKLKKGSGPRHLATYNNFIYSSNELNNSISVIEYTNKIFKVKDTIKLSDYGYPSEIKTYKNNLFITNREDNKIYWFQIKENGLLNLILTKNTGSCPRHFDISNDGNFLIVANQKDNNCIMYIIDINEKKLTFHKKFKVVSPNFVKFMN